MSESSPTAAPPPSERPGDFVAPPPVADIARRILAIIGKHRWAASLAAAAILVAGVAGTYFAPRKYSAVAKILIHPSNPTVLDKVKEVQEESWLRGPTGLTQFYNTQQDIIAGKSVAELVVERLGLDRDASFVGALTDRDTGQPHTADELRRRAVQRLRDTLKLRQGTDSQVFTITITDRDPQRAADIANAVASSYRDFVLSLRIALTRTTSEWLDEQVAIQRELLTKSEAAIQQFTQSNAIQGMGISAFRNLSSERVAELQDKVFDARLSRQEAEAQLGTYRSWTGSGKPASDFPGFASDAEVADLRGRLAGLDREIARKAERYGAEWPALIADRTERETLWRQLGSAVDRAIGALQSKLDEAAQIEGAAAANLQLISDEAVRLAELEVEYNRLRRDAETNADLYEQVLRRAKETQLARSLQASNVNLLEIAEPPRKPSFPRVPFNLAATLLAAILGGALAAFLLEAGDSTVQDPAELDAFFKIWPLGVLPTFGLEDDDGLIRAGRSETAASECLRAVRTNVLFQRTRRPLKRILVTSASPRDGKTTLCSNLAATMALAGNRVLLVDTDMRRPRVHKSFGLENQVGVADVLAGAATVSEAVQGTHISGLHVLSCGTLPSNPAEMLSGNAFRNLLERLEADFDFVLLDSPPVLAVTDASILSQYSDGVILVIRIGKTERRNFGDALRALGSVHASILGVVCNGVDLSKRSAYGYGYGYGGYRPYGSDQDEPSARPIAIGETTKRSG